eukprot:CAMPEP_0185746580 /NCGR_PEP_ID=MMETSP1174-20130828/5173_1 /TAXON_ID=35687 /ORGANISM="Dictyocha speculum, Strain CCMP1381" /LENGTH=754 /DNA_ID=CAMNT_0028421361 /DNA_START=123 /DNA_END=2387 /DNA_ORIENTATION=+
MNGILGSGKSKPLYSWSDFKIPRGLGKKNFTPLRFPDYMLLSQNYYNSSWSIGGLHRLKNIMVILEWVPSKSAIELVGDTDDDLKSCEHEEKEETAIDEILGMYDTPSAMLTRDEAIAIIQTFDHQGFLNDENLELALDELDVTGEGVSVDELRQSLKTRRIYGVEKGRYFVAVSLAEAETIRAALHIAQIQAAKKFKEVNEVATASAAAAAASAASQLGNQIDASSAARQVVELAIQEAKVEMDEEAVAEDCSWLMGHGGETCLALHLADNGLWSMGDSDDDDDDDTLPSVAPLDASPTFEPAGEFQKEIANLLYRFIDSELDMDADEVELLAWQLRRDPWKARLEYFENVRACRRRSQRSWDSTPLKHLFTDDDTLGLYLRAMVSRIKMAMRSERIFAIELWQFLDQEGNNSLSCHELYNGLRALGVKLLQDQVYDLLRSLDSNNDGRIERNEFVATFVDEKMEDAIRLQRNMDGEEETPVRRLMRTKSVRERGSFFITGVEDPMMTETDPLKKLLQLVPKEKFGDFSFYLDDNLGSMKLIWNSTGTMQNTKASLWAPSENHSSKSRRVCLGHYGHFGHNRQPASDAEYGDSPSKRMVVVDDASVSSFGWGKSDYLDTVVECIFPHPKNFHMVWSCTRGKTPLFVWSPVPPTESFVALGMVCTADEASPPLTTIRCVPHCWVKPSTHEPKYLWDDVGLSAKPASLWLMGKMRLMHAVPGKDKPEPSSFFDFEKIRTTLDYDEICALVAERDE